MGKKHFVVTMVFVSWLVIGLLPALANGVLVQIDVKPDSTENVINVGSYGLVPVAILSSADFDATTVDPGSVLLSGASVPMRGNSNKYMAHIQDVDADGLDDILLQVETQTWGEQLETGPVWLTGTTTEGMPIEGTDVVTVVPPV